METSSNRKTNRTISLFLLTLFLAGCGRKPLTELSPTEALKKHARAAEWHDHETLRILTYRELGMTDEDFDKIINSESEDNVAYLSPVGSRCTTP
jgi:PBP1b-binding outer membrane lipoprotein LpoB